MVLKIQSHLKVVSWKLFHVFEKYSLLEATLRKAPKITHQVLHPGNCKQNVPVALAIFHESTSAAVTSYFPEKKNEAEFLKLFNTWWIISNSKVQFSNHILGQAAKKDDGKPEFCRVLADWIETWCNERVPSFEQFTLSLSTAKALIRTLRCQASLIEDLLDDGYDFILTARFQSDPLERRFGQYRQMSGGRILVGLKDTICSEKILKIKCLLKEDIDIDEEIKISCPGEMEIMKLKTDIDSLGISLDTLMLSPDSREVAVHIAGYTAKRYSKKIKSSSCCKMHITGSIDIENPDHEYLIILN